MWSTVQESNLSNTVLQAAAFTYQPTVLMALSAGVEPAISRLTAERFTTQLQEDVASTTGVKPVLLP